MIVTSCTKREPMTSTMLHDAEDKGVCIPLYIYPTKGASVYSGLCNHRCGPLLSPEDTRPPSPLLPITCCFRPRPLVSFVQRRRGRTSSQHRRDSNNRDVLGLLKNQPKFIGRSGLEFVVVLDVAVPPGVGALVVAVRKIHFLPPGRKTGYVAAVVGESSGAEEGGKRDYVGVVGVVWWKCG